MLKYTGFSKKCVYLKIKVGIIDWFLNNDKSLDLSVSTFKKKKMLEMIEFTKM